ncbi:MAG: hypothetical protein VW239_01105 [Candidatus Nanopelagicales bacterium]
MGRMSPYHNPAAGITSGQSLPPVSRNGDTTNTANGSSVDLRGKRGAYFTINVGAITGAANYLAYLQTGDNLDDAANANWTNVNTTTYTNAGLTVKTNANTTWEMDYDPATAGVAQVRAVLVTDANAAVVGIVHHTY